MAAPWLDVPGRESPLGRGRRGVAVAAGRCVVSASSSLLSSLADVSTGEAARQVRAATAAAFARELADDEAAAHLAALKAAEAARLAAAASKAAADATRAAAKTKIPPVSPGPAAATADDRYQPIELEAVELSAFGTAARAAEATLAAEAADLAARAALNAIALLALEPCARRRRATPF